MGTKRLTERFAFSGGTVRRGGPYPVVEGVLLCGPTSLNRRRYTAAAFAGDRVKRYNDRPVFLNHGRGRESRDYQDKIATVENARHRADGMPVGDLAVNPKHPYAEAFLHDAEHKPQSCGMSHVADCRTKPAADGWDDVTEMLAAESVDIVVDPATTKGLYENRGGRAVPFTWKQLVEWVAKHPKAKTKLVERVRRTAEMDGMADAPALDAEPAGDADPDATVTDGLKQAGHDAWDACVAGSMTVQELTKKLKDILKDHGKYSGKGDDAGADDDADDDAPAKESHKKPSIGAVLAECRTAGLKAPSATTLMVLSELPGKATRAAVIEEALAAANPAEPPRSGGRQTKVAEAKGGPAAVPTDAKGFAGLIRE